MKSEPKKNSFLSPPQPPSENCLTNCKSFSIDDEICNDVWVIFFLDQTLVGFLFVVAAMITNCRVKNLGNYLALLLQEER